METRRYCLPFVCMHVCMYVQITYNYHCYILPKVASRRCHFLPTSIVLSFCYCNKYRLSQQSWIGAISSRIPRQWGEQGEWGELCVVTSNSIPNGSYQMCRGRPGCTAGKTSPLKADPVLGTRFSARRFLSCDSEPDCRVGFCQIFMLPEIKSLYVT